MHIIEQKSGLRILLKALQNFQRLSPMVHLDIGCVFILACSFFDLEAQTCVCELANQKHQGKKESN